MKRSDWIYLSRQIERAATKEEAEKLLLEITRLEISDTLDRLVRRPDSTPPTN